MNNLCSELLSDLIPGPFEEHFTIQVFSLWDWSWCYDIGFEDIGFEYICSDDIRSEDFGYYWHWLLQTLVIIIIFYFMSSSSGKQQRLIFLQIIQANKK